MPGGRGGVLAIAALLLVAVGIGAWQLWWPAVGVPDRVCQQAIPGRYAADVLPKRGEHFDEEFVYAFTTAGIYWRHSGTCTLSGGGRGLGIDFVRQRTSDYDSADLAEDRGRPGNRPVRLGPALGFAHGWRVDLFTDCSSPNGKAFLRVEVSMDGSGKPDDEELQNLADLAGGTMRAVANKRIACKEGTPKLPDGAPKLG
ncbi:hypothetical protein [Streptomyces sp. TS71-3]|uniref:hypothetical protein n=1 Tax=Streptomyces sp. TS71-3 TaxID=2733862 RepID=UPI001BB39898|nr:hypothetical protein [Streptomyces sp. TS71-3]